MTGREGAGGTDVGPGSLVFGGTVERIIFGLTEAWAEAEAALPKGWDMRGLAHGSPIDETEWVAAAGTMPFWESPSKVRGYGPTPAAALQALAAALRSRS